MEQKAKTEGARPDLVETAQIARRRDRAQTLGFAGRGDFLYRETAELLAEKLHDVTRTFDQAVLIGTGGGVVAARLAPRIGEARQLEVSPARAAAAGVEPVAMLDPLPLAGESADLIISTLELHWANDPVGQLIQMRRALRPDGLMLAGLFGGQTLAELRACLAEAEVAVTGGLSPRVAPMGEIRDLGGLLQRAGFVLPVADSERLTVTYPDPVALMHDLRAMGETNMLAGRRRTPLRRAVLAETARIYAERFAAPGGRIVATFEIVFLTGWSPGPDQPTPLRPGSATTRLADALGTDEMSAGEPARPGRREP